MWLSSHTLGSVGPSGLSLGSLLATNSLSSISSALHGFYSWSHGLLSRELRNNDSAIEEQKVVAQSQASSNFPILYLRWKLTETLGIEKRYIHSSGLWSDLIMNASARKSS